MDPCDAPIRILQIWFLGTPLDCASKIGVKSTVITFTTVKLYHDHVIKWKHFPRYWPFMWGIPRVAGEVPAQRPVTRSFDVFSESKQSWGWWFETPSRSLWSHCIDGNYFLYLSDAPFINCLLGHSINRSLVHKWRHFLGWSYETPL